MYTYQFIVLAVTLALLLNKECRSLSLVLLLYWLSYFNFVEPLGANLFYSLSAGLNALVAIFFQRKSRTFAAICSYSLVLANVYGYGIWYAYISPVSYDIICSILIILQLIGILPRAIHDGIRRVLDEFGVVKPPFFNSCKTYVKMYKNTSTKKTHR